jgi:hypothetical protein
MVWKLKQVWCNHTYQRGKHKGHAHFAFPIWDETRKGYLTYPAGTESSNRLDDAEVAETIEELYEHLSQGRGVRCTVPSTAQNPILNGPFQAIFEQI